MYKKLKIIIALFGFSMIAACAALGGNSAMTVTDQTFLSACDSYNAMMVFFIQEYQAGKLSKADVAKINQFRLAAVPLCENPAPANPQQATMDVLNAVSNLETLKTTVINTSVPAK